MWIFVASIYLICNLCVYYNEEVQENEELTWENVVVEFCLSLLFLWPSLQRQHLLSNQMLTSNRVWESISRFYISYDIHKEVWRILPKEPQVKREILNCPYWNILTLDSISFCQIFYSLLVMYNKIFNVHSNNLKKKVFQWTL